MKTKTIRKLTALATTALIALGSANAANAATIAPQPLGTFGGTFDCVAGKTGTVIVTSTGGNVYVFGGKLLHNGYVKEGQQPFPSGIRSGAWTVSGAASSASVECIAGLGYV